MLREEEKRRKRVNQGLPKIIDEIKALTQEYFDQNGKEFLIRGMTFDELSHHKEAKHDQEVTMEKEKKKEVGMSNFNIHIFAKKIIHEFFTGKEKTACL